MPYDLLAVTLFASTVLRSMASMRIPVPGGTSQTVSSGSRQVFFLLLPDTRLWSIRLSEFDFTSRFGSVKDRMPPVLPVARLWSARMWELFSSSNPLTLSFATLWSTRAWLDWPM